MPKTIMSKPTASRCYSCKGEKPVEMVCHHCGIPICKDHGPTNPPGSSFKNNEFDGLKLPNISNKSIPVHCRNCLHFIFSNKIKMGISIGFFLFLTLIAWNPMKINWVQSNIVETQNRFVVYILLILPLFFFLKTLSAFLKAYKYWSNIQSHKPPFPTIGSFEEVFIEENIKGRISIKGDAGYFDNVEQATGTLKFKFRFDSRDKKNFLLYLKKHKLKPKNVDFSAGFAALRKGVSLKFESPNIFMDDSKNVIQFSGDISKQPYFDSQENSNKEGHEDEKNNTAVLTFSYQYDFQDSQEDGLNLPVQIFPAFLPGGDRQEIEIAVQIPQDSINLKNTNNVIIESLEIFAPQEMGKVKGVEPSAIINDSIQKNDLYFRKIKWTDVMFIKTEKTFKKIFYIKFENQINSKGKFMGEVKLKIDRALSDFGKVMVDNNTQVFDLFHPTGHKRTENIEHSQKTSVFIPFEMDLRNLMFQENFLKTDCVERKGIVPNQKLVKNLTDMISDVGFYIKRTIENFPRTSKASAHILTYFWDIGGRIYKGFFPIDFHLVISGEENFLDQSLSKTRIDASVQGVVIDNKSREEVLYSLENLVQIIGEVLDQIPEMPSVTSEQGASLDFFDFDKDEIGQKESGDLSIGNLKPKAASELIAEILDLFQRYGLR